MFDTILVVCIGNVCRSPVGERILRQLLPEKKITSAGVSALVGCPVDDMTAAAARVHNIDTSRHVAKQLTIEMCENADLILAMSEEVRQIIHQLAPFTKGKVLLFGKWLGDIDIPDPFKQKKQVHERSVELIRKAAAEWEGVAKLQI